MTDRTYDLLLQIQRSIQTLQFKVDVMTNQQDEINAIDTELQDAFDALSAEIAALEQANPALDLTVLKAKADALAALAAPPAAPAP